MEKIVLQSGQTRALLYGLFAMGGAIPLFYHGYFHPKNLSLYSVQLNAGTMAVIIISIGVAIFAVGIHGLIKYISLVRYGEFALVLDTETLTLPQNKLLRGFGRIHIPKSQIDHVQLINRGQRAYQINLNNKAGQTFACIHSNLCREKIDPKELANKIAHWLHRP